MAGGPGLRRGRCLIAATEEVNKPRFETLADEYRAKGCSPTLARFKAQQRYDVETTSPGIMAWIGGIGLAIVSWGLIPIAIWVWEVAFDTPGHARRVFRWSAWLWLTLLAIGLVIALIVVVASSGSGSDGDGRERIAKGRLESTLRAKIESEYPRTIDVVNCEGGIGAGETVECTLESDGNAIRLDVAAVGGPGELDLTVDVPR